MEISLCMIVKNEERILARCLDSVAHLVDEIIIVDTGSTDATKAIGAKYTDKIYDFIWVDDFAAARNYSFSKATKEYIYLADADEVIDQENQVRFAKMKEALLPEIDVVQMKYGNQLEQGTTYNFDEEYRPKLFKRLREFVWEEPIHEMVRLTPVVFDSQIVITHLPENVHAKRDFQTFQKHINKGATLSKRLHHMYAMELYITGEEADFLEAEPFFTATIKEGTRSMDEIKEAACIVTRCARLKKDCGSILKMCLKDLLTEGSAEMCYELGLYFMEQGDFEEASVWFYNGAFETPSILNIHACTDWPLKELIVCQEKLGNQQSADAYRQQYSEKYTNN